MSTRIGAERHRECGCISQYGMWQPNVLTWTTVLLCGRHDKATADAITR